MIFFFDFIYIVDYVTGFSFIDLILHPWDESHMIVVNHGFDVFFNSVFKNFVEYICIDIHMQDLFEGHFFV